MLSRDRRVKRQDFPRIIKEGLVFYSPHLSLRVVDGDSSKLTAAVVVSSVVGKTSVKRHFIKRQISSLLESRWSLIKSGALVVTCKQAFSDKERLIIDRELNSLLSSAKLLK